MTTAAIPRPEPSEYVPYYETYLSKVPKGDLLTLLENQRRETQQLLSGLSEAKALHRYAPGKWSIKEVVGHLMDTERVFCYRALAFGRADANPLPGFDEKAWVPPGRFDARPLKDLAAELDAVRRATIALFSGLDADALERRGTANNNPITVRALAWIIVGHERHHGGSVTWHEPGDLPVPRRSGGAGRYRQLRHPQLPIRERRGAARAAAPLPHARPAAARCRWSGAQCRPASPRHGRVGRAVPVTAVRRRAVRPRPTARYRHARPDPARQRRTRPLLQAERRAARAIPALRLRGHGHGPVPPRHGRAARES